MTALSRTAWKRRPRGTPRHTSVGRYALYTPPLVGTLGRTETEVAAAVIIFAQERLGLAWGTPIGRAALGACLRAAVKADVEPLVSWTRDPALMPDFDALVAGGWATADAESATLALTPALREAIACYAEAP
jgi:hypothetical protein